MAKRSATVQSQTNRPAVWMPRATLITPQRTFWNVVTAPFSILYLWEFIHISLKFQSYIFESSFLYLWFVKHISLKKRSYSLENRLRYLSKTIFYLYGTPLLSPGNVPFTSGFIPFLGRKSLHTAFGNERKWRERPLLCPFGSWKSFTLQEVEWPKHNEYFLFERWLAE